MFGINTYSRVKQCLVLQHYASSCMAMKKRTSGSVELDPQHRVHHLNCEHRSVSSVCHDRRDFHTSSNCAGKNLLRKFVNKTKKKLWYETPPQGPPSSQLSALKPPKKRSQEDNMRTRILNSILYKAITDLLSSPEVNYEVYNYSVDISRVSLPADFSSCRVYWKTSGVSERDDQIQQALDKSSPRIRYLIMAHQTLGGVPPLVFIKDKQYAAMSEVENLLKMADFGPEDGLGERQHVVESAQPSTSKKPVLFGVDHDALNKQILDYKLRVKDTTSNTLAPELTLQQLEVLAEYRKQKIMEKKKKSKRPVDDDITPKEYLLSRRSQGQEREEEDGRAFSQEDDQVRELMAEESRKS
nr:putative ribosome-binding factor A, mitochondrial [Salvelinus alpinus]